MRVGLPSQTRSCACVLVCAAVLLPGLTRAETASEVAIMAGTKYETPMYVKDSGRPGPTVVIIGGVHGNEPAGYLAARRIANWRCETGTLVVVPDAHREAIRRNARGYPGNMNAMFPGKADGSDMERLAHDLWQRAIVEFHPDLLLTLHESLDFHARDPQRFGQSLVYDSEELTPLMSCCLDRVNADIDKKLHQFVLFCKAFPNCPTYEAWFQLGVPSTSIETSRTMERDTRVRYQLMMVMAFLDQLGMEYEQDDVPWLSTRSLSPEAPRAPREKAAGGAGRREVATAVPIEWPAVTEAPPAEPPKVDPSATQSAETGGDATPPNAPEMGADPRPETNTMAAAVRSEQPKAAGRTSAAKWFLVAAAAVLFVVGAWLVWGGRRQ